MKFSFTVLHYNQFEEISTQLIPSIEMALDGFFDYDICIMDDSSEEFELLKTLESDKIKVLQCPTRKNQSMARNLAIANTTGDIILSIDGDDWYSPTGLRTVCQWVVDNPEYDVYSSRVTRPYVRTDNFMSTTTLSPKHSYKTHTGNMQYMIKREYLDRVGLRWDEEKYFWDSEDAYFHTLLIGMTNSVARIEVDGPVGIHPLYDGGNSDREGLTLLNHTLYLIQMHSDAYPKLTSELGKKLAIVKAKSHINKYRNLTRYRLVPSNIKKLIDENIAKVSLKEFLK